MNHGYRENGSDHAVTKIIGTILVVAVAVILAALISSFTFGMAAGVTRTIAIAVSVEQVNDNIVLTYMNGEDRPMLYRLDVTATAEDGTTSSGFFPVPPAVGDVLTISGAGNAGSDHVVVVAQLVDGTRQVVFDVVV